jgi:hypothetical protein
VETPEMPDDWADRVRSILREAETPSDKIEWTTCRLCEIIGEWGDLTAGNEAEAHRYGTEGNHDAGI